MVPILWIAGAVAALLGLVWFFQRSLIYLPLDHDVPQPAQVGLARAEPVRFATADGLTLGAWLVPAAQGGARATVLVFNGNAGNRGGRAPLAARLSAAGFAVLLLDYRGYGENPGRPTERGLVEDALAARRWVDARPDLASGRVVYFGESLGAAVAVALAVERPPAALVLRSPFTTLAEVGRIHYPCLPVGALLVDRWSSIARIGRVDCPLLVVAGSRDRIVPAELSRRLFEASPGRGPKRMSTIEGADHNDMALLAGDELIGGVTRFLEEVLG